MGVFFWNKCLLQSPFCFPRTPSFALDTRPFTKAWGRAFLLRQRSTGTCGIFRIYACGIPTEEPGAVGRAVRRNTFLRPRGGGTV